MREQICIKHEKELATQLADALLNIVNEKEKLMSVILAFSDSVSDIAELSPDDVAKITSLAFTVFPCLFAKEPDVIAPFFDAFELIEQGKDELIKKTMQEAKNHVKH